MATATAIKTDSSAPSVAATGEQALSEGELRAWRGLKRAHASLAKRVDAELERTHGLPLTSYEVLHHLVESTGGRAGTGGALSCSGDRGASF